MNLGNNIRELRRSRGLTQEQLAMSLNISPQAVSKWEIGASFPDMTMIPVIASLFGVSLDELFDFDVKDIDSEIEKIILEYKKWFWSDFGKAESILLDGLKLYPVSTKLKAELFELYSYNIHNCVERINQIFELGWHIVYVSQDVFCSCRTKANLIRIYKYLENYYGKDHYDDIKKIIESLPYIYPYMLQDKMRLSAEYLKGNDGLKEAIELKYIEWQELFIACHTAGDKYFEVHDYENALKAYVESVDVIERFMDMDKVGYETYPIGGTHSNHAMTYLSIASCMFKVGKTEEIDALIGKAKKIYFDAYKHMELTEDELRGMSDEMIQYFNKEYERNGLCEYKSLDLSDVR